MWKALLLLLFCAGGCTTPPAALEYAHPALPFSQESVAAVRHPAADRGGASLVVLVDAVGIDYSTPDRFLKTMARHPRGAKGERSVGHAWIILKGPLTWLECGHTGEFGLDSPGYRDSVYDSIRRGDSNPAACFWNDARNGRYESGSGGHRPTLAVEFPLSLSEYERTRQFIDAYDFTPFSLRENVCTHFVVRSAACAGIELGHNVTLNIPRQTRFKGQIVRWWSDPRYALLDCGSPDVLEKSLGLAVQKGIGRDVTGEYQRRE